MDDRGALWCEVPSSVSARRYAWKRVSPLAWSLCFFFDYIAVEELVASGSEDAQAGGNSVFSA